MSVSKRGLKSVLCIQELDHFIYTPLLISLKNLLLSSRVCVNNTYFSHKKKKKRIN